MHKAMVYLEEHQFETLNRLAKKQKRTFASLFREAVDGLISTETALAGTAKKSLPASKGKEAASEVRQNPSGKTVVLGVCGGIAAYKSCEIARLLVKSGHSVHVMMTKAAAEFVTPLTFQALTGNPVASDLFSLTQESEIGHIQLADRADVMLIAPATADMIAKAAHGLCDDIVSTVLLATRAPIVFAPSMNVNMYDNPITQDNIARLRKLSRTVLEPGSGFLACGWEGKGRLAEPEDIVAAVNTRLKKK